MPIILKKIRSKEVSVKGRLQRLLFYIAFILVFLPSCRKDPTFNSCVDIPDWSGVGFGYQYHVSDEYYELPEFNPNNFEEIIFCENNKLYKFNLSNYDKSMIFEGGLNAQPSWGCNDWILLSRNDNNIWKIKENGDSLTQLTFDGNSSYAQWNFDGSKYSYVASGTSGGGLVFRNADNSIIDTIQNGAGGCWKNIEGLIVDAATIEKADENSWKFGVEIVDPTNDQIIYTHYLESVSDFSSVNGEAWLGDKFSVVWSCGQGVFRTNYFGNTTSKLSASCNSLYYLNPTYNSKDDQIIWQRIDKSLIDEDNILVSSVLVIMNSDGTNERVLEIP